MPVDETSINRIIPVHVDETFVKDQYLKLLRKLLDIRTKSEYSDKIEMEYCAKLDVLWWKMTDKEQKEVEAVAVQFNKGE